MINFKKGGYCFAVHYRCGVELIIMDFVEFEFNDNSFYIMKNDCE